MGQIDITFSECSSAGRKAINQDFVGSKQPANLLERIKGQAYIVADGISSSKVSHIASQTAVRNFISDYYSTSDTWSIEKSGKTVLTAINSWLYAQGQKLPSRYDKDKGYICTITALIMRSNTAHIFHAGDSRVALVRNGQYTVITEAHRREVSQDVSYLTRGLGIQISIDIDYQTLPIQEGDVLIISTDGVHDWLENNQSIKLLEQCEHFESVSKQMIDAAYANGSDDNLSAQVIRINTLPEISLDEVGLGIKGINIPPPLSTRKIFEGYQVLRKLHVGPRSHVYLAKHLESEQQCVLKIPSEHYKDNQAYLEQFLLEEWIAKRVNNTHVLKAMEGHHHKSYIYTVTEYIDGQTLRQWMIDNPNPEFTKVRDVIGQIAKGLNAFHRQEMIYQDLRPENIMIDKDGVVKIIDFGAVYVPGIEEMRQINELTVMPGTARYSAPEYFLGEQPKTNADLFSLAIIAYEMLAGKLPYGMSLGKAKSQNDINKLKYQPIMELELGLPHWLDNVLKKALEIDRRKRFQEVSEFIYQFNSPSKYFLQPKKLPLIEKHPVQFWKAIAGILFVAVIVQAVLLYRLF